MAKKNAEPFVAGWMFWGIIFLVLSPVAIYFCWQIVEAEESRLIPVGMGLLLAALGAGFVAWAVNAVIQWAQRQRKNDARKKAKKK